jgi:tRNA-dihydrouridine synthase
MSFWQEISPPIIGLSPMDGVTDAAFRYIVARYGTPDVQCTEFVSVDEICHGGEMAWHQLRYAEIERPVVAQIYGADPEKFYEIAQVVCELGFDGVDINMGCPSKSVAARGCGAALIKNPSLAQQIIRAVRAGVTDWAAGRQVDKLTLPPKAIENLQKIISQRNGPAVRRPLPVSVKTRLGYDSVVIEDWVSVLLEAEPDVIAIHGRTLTQMYRGQADWAAIARAAKIIRQTSTLVLGNGDIESMPDLVNRVLDTHVHGVLIGRACLGNPWLFRQKAWAKSQIPPHPFPLPPGERENLSLPDPVPSPHSNGERVRVRGLEDVPLTDRFRVALEHARYFESLSDLSRFAAMRKHLGWYCKGFPGAAETRARMFQSRNSRDVERVLTEVGFVNA